MIECPVCGNERDPPGSTCAYCGAALEPLRPALSTPRESYRTVNLKHDMPTVDQCRLRLDFELARARADGVAALKLIHGYGASGVGGELRHAVRAVLDRLAATGKIAMAVPGEDLINQRRTLLRRVPSMKGDPDLRKSNPGVTVVVFR